MVIWFLCFLVSLVCMVLCYTTNPFVVLFANEDGELPGFLALWQTWDNSCNPSELVDILPDWLQFDWAKHYEEYKGTTPYLYDVNRERWFTRCIDDNFTFTEQIKRYIGRVWWLTRNCSYGFSFYSLGQNVTPRFEIKESENTRFVKEVYGEGLWGSWQYKNTAKIFSLWGYELHWNLLLGWKIDTDATVDTRAMIANRIAWFIKKEEEK